MAQVKITLVKSLIGSKPNQRANAKALGLGKMHSYVVQPDNDATRGMIRKVNHLVKVEQVN